MRLAVVADLHAHNYAKYSHIAESGLNSRLDWILREFDEIIDICVQRQVHALVIAGDLFHSRKAIDITVLEAVYKRIKSVKDFPMFIVAGNHDVSESSVKSVSIRVLSKLLTVVTKPKIISVLNKSVGLIPWTESAKAVAKALDTFKESNVQHVVGHLALRSGVVGEHEYIMEGGIEPSVFRDFQWVALGHYHKHQKVGDNIYYVGSPLQHTWGESGDDKGFMIFGGAQPEFIDLVDFPRFVKVTSKKEAKQVRSIDYVKVIGNRETVEKIELPDDVQRIEVIEKSDEYKSRLDFEGTSLKSIVTTYCKSFPQDMVDEEFLIEVGLDYLKG